MTSGKTARTEREQRAAAQQAAADRGNRRRRTGIRLGVALAVVLAVVGFGLLVQSQRGSSGSSATPAHTSGAANGVVTVGQAGAPVTVTAYEDFQCPVCKEFETDLGPTIASLVEAGTVKVEYHPIAILDSRSSTRYASRSLSAAGCVANADPSAYQRFHDLLFANQPAENSSGLTSKRLAELAQQAGAGGAADCVRADTYLGWAERVTDQSSKDGVNSTPTVLVAGKPLQDRSAAGLKAAVEAAQG